MRFYDLCENEFIDQFKKSYGILPKSQYKIFRYAEVSNHNFTGSGQTYYWHPDLITYKSGSLPYDITTPMFLGDVWFKVTIPISIASPSFQFSFAWYNYLSFDIAAATVNEGYIEFWMTTSANNGNPAPWKFQSIFFTPENSVFELYGPGLEMYFNGTVSDQISFALIFKGWRVQLV